MLSKEFLAEAYNPNRYEYKNRDFVRSPHFVERLTNRLPDETNRIGYMQWTVDDFKPTMERIYARQRILDEKFDVGDLFWICDKLSNCSVLCSRQLPQKGKVIYYLTTCITPSKRGDWVKPRNNKGAEVYNIP